MSSTQITDISNVVFEFSHAVISIQTVTKYLALDPFIAIIIFYTRVEFPTFVPKINRKAAAKLIVPFLLIFPGQVAMICFCSKCVVKTPAAPFITSSYMYNQRLSWLRVPRAITKIKVQ